MVCAHGLLFLRRQCGVEASAAAAHEGEHCAATHHPPVGSLADRSRQALQGGSHELHWCNYCASNASPTTALAVSSKAAARFLPDDVAKVLRRRPCFRQWLTWRGRPSRCKLPPSSTVHRTFSVQKLRLGNDGDTRVCSYFLSGPTAPRK